MKERKLRPFQLSDAAYINVVSEDFRMNATCTEIAYSHIRRRIMKGEYSPGTALRTVVLATETGVSRTPVREALRKLEIDGLVSIHGNVGAEVRACRLDELLELSDLRILLEIHAAGLAAKVHSESGLRAIYHTQQKIDGLIETTGGHWDDESLLLELADHHAAFLKTILSAAKNATIEREVLRLHMIHSVQAGYVVRSKQMTPSIDSILKRIVCMARHQHIYDAISREDSTAAMHEMGQLVRAFGVPYTLLVSRSLCNLVEAI